LQLILDQKLGALFEILLQFADADQLLQRFRATIQPKVGDLQACGVVAYHALDILRETFGGLSVDVDRQCQLDAANAI
jgi:hypothetical protein